LKNFEREFNFEKGGGHKQKQKFNILAKGMYKETKSQHTHSNLWVVFHP
jgi:hypothetical protein